jgi:hypothetical protein
MKLCLLPASCWFLLGLSFDPEDGGDMFLQNVSCLSVDYMAFIPEDRILSSSQKKY